MTYGTEVFNWVGQEDDLRTDPMIKVKKNMIEKIKNLIFYHYIV